MSRRALMPPLHASGFQDEAPTATAVQRSGRAERQGRSGECPTALPGAGATPVRPAPHPARAAPAHRAGSGEHRAPRRAGPASPRPPRPRPPCFRRLPGSPRRPPLPAGHRRRLQGKAALGQAAPPSGAAAPPPREEGAGAATRLKRTQIGVSLLQNTRDPCILNDVIYFL